MVSRMLSLQLKVPPALLQQSFCRLALCSDTVGTRVPNEQTSGPQCPDASWALAQGAAWALPVCTSLLGVVRALAVLPPPPTRATPVSPAAGRMSVSLPGALHVCAVQDRFHVSAGGRRRAVPSCAANQGEAPNQKKASKVEHT